jgi:uncharacterized membrane protein YecN with MAPEG domain
MTTAIVCTGLLGILVFGLGFAVSGTRGRTGTNFAFTPDPTNRVYRLVRAHGNATEYAPMLAVLMLFVGSREPSEWLLWVMGITTAARYVHVGGMLTGPALDKINPFRFVGALLTYLGGLILSATLIRMM